MQGINPGRAWQASTTLPMNLLYSWLARGDLDQSFPVSQPDGSTTMMSLKHLAAMPAGQHMHMQVCFLWPLVSTTGEQQNIADFHLLWQQQPVSNINNFLHDLRWTNSLWMQLWRAACPCSKLSGRELDISSCLQFHSPFVLVSTRLLSILSTCQTQLCLIDPMHEMHLSEH